MSSEEGLCVIMERSGLSRMYEKKNELSRRICGYGRRPSSFVVRSAESNAITMTKPGPRPSVFNSGVENSLGSSRAWEELCAGRGAGGLKIQNILRVDVEESSLGAVD